MIIQALQRLGPANDHSGTAGECSPLLLSTELPEGFHNIQSRPLPTMAFSLLKAPIYYLRNFSLFVINIAHKCPNFREWPTPNIVKFSRNFIHSSISYWPQSRRIWSEDAVAAAAAGCPNKTNYRRVWTNFEDNNSNFRASGLGSAGRPAAVLHLFICFATNWVLCSVFSVECKVQTILTSM